MTNTTNEQIPVYEQRSSAEYARIANILDESTDPRLWGDKTDAAVAQLPACVLIGKFASYQDGQFGGATSMNEGTPVTGYAPGGQVVYATCVWARNVYEPESRNKIGGLGAYRPVPNEEAIAQAVEAARQAIARHE